MYIVNLLTILLSHVHHIIHKNVNANRLTGDVVTCVLTERSESTGSV